MVCRGDMSKPRPRRVPGTPRRRPATSSSRRRARCSARRRPTAEGRRDCGASPRNLLGTFLQAAAQREAAKSRDAALARAGEEAAAATAAAAASAAQQEQLYSEAAKLQAEVARLRREGCGGRAAMSPRASF